jgi:hypothetical protein
MNKTLLCKIILFPAAAAIVFACNLPKPHATSKSPTAAPQTTVHLLPGNKTILILPTSVTPSASATPSATAAPTVDDFFVRCPTADEIALVDKDLNLQFETDPTAGKTVCLASSGSADLTAIQKRAYQSVLVMKQLTFDAPLYDWFIGAIQGIRFRGDIQNSYCCEPAGVIDVAIAGNSYLLLTDRWVNPSLGGGLMDTMILFVHEARHNEGFVHTCPDGASDKTIAEMGAWGVQYFLFLWIAQHGQRPFLRAPGNDPNAYRRLALQDALDTQRVRFCNEPTATPGPGPTLAP